MQRPWVVTLMLVAALAMGSLVYYESNPPRAATAPVAGAPAAQAVEDAPGATTPDGGGANGIIPPSE